MSCLVVGATGFVGSALVRTLCDAGQRVRAASRHPPAHELAGAEWIECDLERPDTVTAALQGVDVAYYLVHSLGAREYRERDRRSASNFAHAAALSDCRRIIYLGGVAPKGLPSEHLASRLEVGEILRSGRVPTIELRASMIIGNGSASWRIVRDLAARLPVMILPRWLESKSCPIALVDVIAALREARTFTLGRNRGTWFDIPGPDVLSAREMLAIVAELDGRRIPSVRVPVLTPSLSAMWLRLVSGADYRVARELVLGLTEDLLPVRSFWDHIDAPPRMSFRAAAREALATAPQLSPLARAVERVVHRVGVHVRP